MRILDELGSELERAARAAEARRGGGRARSLPQTIAIALVAVLAVTGVALAARAVIKNGDPLPAPNVLDVPAELTPAPGSEQMNGLAVADPDGGPAWDVRTSRSRTGAVCTTVGQVLGGELGIVGLDGEFHALPAGAADTCSVAQRDGFTLAGARGFRGRAGTPGITVVSGVAGSGVRAVQAVGGRSVRTLRLGPARAFLTIFAAQPETLRPRVVATLASGRRVTVRFADTGEQLVPDPSGGTPWSIKAVPARRPGLRCVGGRRLRGPDSPTPTRVAFQTAEVPVRCGRRGQPFVATQRFVPVAPHVGSVAFRWGANVARTIVWGSTGGARDVRLRGARAAVTVHGDLYMVVLWGKVDPRRLAVRIGSRMLRGTTAVSRRGRPLADVRVPAWRSVAQALRGAPPIDSFEAVPGTTRDGGRAHDPAGGPDWAVRAWRAQLGRRTQASSGTSRTLLCFAAGQVAADGLREPLPDGRSRAIRTPGPEGLCNGNDWLRSHPGGAEATTYVDDPDAPEPKPVRVVVAGLLGEDVRAATLLGAGPPRELKLGPYGSFIAVLEPRYAGSTLRIRQQHDDGTTRTSPGIGFSRSCKPSVPPVRVADPDGGPTWIAGIGGGPVRPERTVVGPNGQRLPGSCRYTGRMIGGRLATVFDGTLQVVYGPTTAAVGGTSGEFLSRRRAVLVEVTGPGQFTRAPATPETAAQRMRRTLPGRTVVTGIARRDVLSITLRTPRDIRTIRPDPRSHVFLAVYDGAFYGGEIVATAHLRGGGTNVVRRPVTF